MPWLWTCHLCRSHFPLAATRRCLEDGHYFCAGTSVDRKSGKIKKHNSCGSEFDYIGWKAWGDWRREYHRQKKSDPVQGSKDCANHCDFPSECRWTAKRAVKLSRFGNPIVEEEKRSKASLTRLIKSAEKRTARLTTPLSPVEEEEEEEGEQSPAATPVGLGLSLPVLDFTSFKSNLDTVHDTSAEDKETSSSVVSIVDLETNIMDLDPASGPSEPQITIRGFEFGFEDSSQAYGRTSPTSPRRNAWDWSIGGIGTALVSVEEVEGSEGSSDEDVEMLNWK